MSTTLKSTCCLCGNRCDIFSALGKDSVVCVDCDKVLDAMVKRFGVNPEFVISNIDFLSTLSNFYGSHDDIFGEFRGVVTRGKVAILYVGITKKFE